MEASIAVRLTLRLTLHATMRRQRITQAPRKARVAPTAMKKVPCGREDCCMNGAPAVQGITRVGMPAPAIVGIPVRWMAASVFVTVGAARPCRLVDVVVRSGAFVKAKVLSVDRPSCVVVRAVVCCVVCAVVSPDVAVVCVAVLRFGTPLNCACVLSGRASKSASSGTACLHRNRAILPAALAAGL